MTSTLEVGTNTYVELDDANTYLGDSIRAASWDFLDDDTKNKCLLTAFRLLERQCWNGTKTGGAAQVAQNPRTGLTLRDGTELDSDEVAQQVLDAQCELAFELSLDTDLETSKSTGSNISSLGAGSARISYFKSTKGDRFSFIVWELISALLCGSAAYSAPFIPGTGEDCTTQTDAGFGLNEGFS